MAIKDTVGNASFKTTLFFAFGIFNGVIFATLYLRYQISCYKPGTVQWDSIEDAITNKEAKNVSSDAQHPTETIDPNILGGTTDPLFDKVKVLCFVITSPGNLNSKTIHVKRTWWNRCNKQMFFSSAADKNFPAIALPAGNGSFPDAIRNAFQYIWDHHKDDADWFLKADDTTYGVLDNLRDFLKDKNPNDPVYYGRKQKGTEAQATIVDEGAGYVLSKAALERFVKSAKDCPTSEKDKPFDVANCLNKAGVQAGDSRDSKMRETFHSHFVSQYSSPTEFGHGALLQKDYNPTCIGISCTTSRPITFHEVSPTDMYVLHYSLYKVRVDGRCIDGYRT